MKQRKNILLPLSMITVFDLTLKHGGRSERNKLAHYLLFSKSMLCLKLSAKEVFLGFIPCQNVANR